MFGGKAPGRIWSETVSRIPPAAVVHVTRLGTGEAPHYGREESVLVSQASIKMYGGALFCSLMMFVFLITPLS